MAVLAVAHTWPLASAPASRSLNHNADAQLNAWTISWIARTVVRDPRHMADGNIFWPERETLAYTEPLVVPALLVAPVAWLGGSAVLAFNLSLLFGLVLTGWSAWYVAARWTGAPDAALVAGALAAFNAHLLTRLPHLQAAHAWGLLWALYWADALVDASSARARTRAAGGLALAVLATSLTSIYWLALAALFVAGAMAAAVLTRRWPGALAMAAGTAAGLVAALPVLWPYARLGASGVVRPLAAVADFSAAPAAYVTSQSRLHAAWTRPWSTDDVNVLFAGVAALALAGLGLAAATRAPAPARRRAAVLAALAALAVVLSFGPATPLYRLLYDWLLPLQGLRAAARFGFAFLVAIALLAGFGAAFFLARQPPRRRRLLALVLLAAVTIEAWHAPIRTTPFDRVPPIYSQLPASDVRLVEVPFWPPEAAFENGEYVLNATAHWQPILNGYSGMTPMSYRRRTESFWFFPAPHAIAAMKAEGATHVMVHLERFGADADAVRLAIDGRQDLRLLAADRDGHRLYELR